MFSLLLNDIFFGVCREIVNKCDWSGYTASSGTSERHAICL